MVRRTGRYITVFPNRGKNYFNGEEALIDEGFKVIHDVPIEKGGLAGWFGQDGDIYLRKNKRYIFVRMDHFNTTIYKIRLAEVE